MKRNTQLMLLIASTAIIASCGGSNKDNETMEETQNTTTTEEATSAPVTIDVQKSMVTWKGVMLGVKYHEGTVQLKEASLTLNGDQVESGSFIIDLTTIQPTDDNYNPKEGYSQEKLVGHLSSADFFDVANHPTASFKINEGSTGMLTIRGNTHEESITDIKVERNDNMVTVSGKVVFDRQKYDVSWASPMKDMVLSDEITINVKLTGTL
ncbi:MAG: YceI family protein [Flavobacteriales bacterium]|nr:YceI family protein [Flavobacteriales bacterium]